LQKFLNYRASLVEMSRLVYHFHDLKKFQNFFATNVKNFIPFL